MKFSDIQGRQLEHAWAKEIRGKVVGGEGDGGVDVAHIRGYTGGFQVKSSIQGTMTHLAVGLRRGLVPVVVGEPDGTPAAVVVEALVTKGYWVSKTVTVRGNLGAVVEKVLGVAGWAHVALRPV